VVEVAEKCCLLQSFFGSHRKNSASRPVSIQFSPTSRDEDERRQIGENRGKKGNHDAISYYPWDWYVYLPTNLPLKNSTIHGIGKISSGKPRGKKETR